MTIVVLFQIIDADICMLYLKGNRHSRQTFYFMQQIKGPDNRLFTKRIVPTERD